MLTSNHILLANIRNIKSQIHPNIRDIAEKMVQEVRYVRPSLNITEGLTRTTETKEALQQLIQTGQYHLPGGFSVFWTLRNQFDQPANSSKSGNTKQRQQLTKKRQVTTGTKESSDGMRPSKQAHINTSKFRQTQWGRQGRERQCQRRRPHHWWISQYEREKRRRQQQTKTHKWKLVH